MRGIAFLTGERSNDMERMSYHPTKRGCPTCDGNDPKTCVRCHGKTRMYDWVLDENGVYVYSAEEH